MTTVALSARWSLVTPVATIRRASMSSPESVSSRIASFGSSIAIWKISFFFFSPPEKPSFTAREVSFASSSTTALFSRIELISTDYKNIDTGFTSKHRKYSKKNEGSPATIEYTVSVPGGKPIYMSIPTDYPRECNLKVDGVSKGTCLGNETDRVIYLGIFDADIMEAGVC